MMAAQWHGSKKNKICNHQSLGGSNSTRKINALFAYEENYKQIQSHIFQCKVKA